MVYDSNRWERSKVARICITAWRRNITSSHGNQKKLQKWLAIYKGQSNSISLTHTKIIITGKTTKTFPRRAESAGDSNTRLSEAPLGTVWFAVASLNYMFLQLGYAGVRQFKSGFPCIRKQKRNGPFLESANSFGERHVVWEANELLEIRRKLGQGSRFRKVLWLLKYLIFT